MNAVLFVIIAIFAVWGALVTMVLVAEMVYRRRQAEQLEIREWTEKVDAMRRLQDKEGNA